MAPGEADGDGATVTAGVAAESSPPAGDSLTGAREAVLAETAEADGVVDSDIDGVADADAEPVAEALAVGDAPDGDGGSTQGLLLVLAGVGCALAASMGDGAEVTAIAPAPAIPADSRARMEPRTTARVRCTRFVRAIS